VATTETTSKPLRADARRNRLLVLDAARECFARDGIAAQMDDIAARAGVGVGTVYRHFETKEALTQALAADYFAGEAALAKAALEEDDPWEAFCFFIRNGAELLAESRALSQISADRPEVMRDAAVAAEVEFGFFGTIETIITRAKDAGALREDFELEDIPAIMCSLGALQISRGAYANWRRVLEIVLDGLRAPAGHPLPPVMIALPRADSAV
jgi:AcrR family transcriptional regulator